MDLPPLDPVIHQATRLRIMALLFRNRSGTFTWVRDTLGLTDGNLDAHVTRLEQAVKRAHDAGQYQWVKEHFAKLPESGLPEKMHAEMRALQSEYETADTNLKLARRVLARRFEGRVTALGRAFHAAEYTCPVPPICVLRFDAAKGMLTSRLRTTMRGTTTERSPSRPCERRSLSSRETEEYLR